MLNKNMDATDSWYTSTPLQCRHDSGYGNLPKCFRFLEFSPIRKQSAEEQQTKNKGRYFGNSDEIYPKRLSFFNLFNEYRQETSKGDSGLASSVNESVSESDSLQGRKNQCFKDENSNFTCLVDSTTGNGLHQPSKYICKDHSCEKSISGKCKKNIGPFKVFKSYVITSDLFKSEKNTKVDIFYELDIRNCTSIISDILSYLSDEDLRQANNVSKKWRDIVSNDKNSDNRRVIYIHNKKNATFGPNKENKVKIATAIERDHKSAFTSLVNVENTKQPLIFEKIIQGRFDSFIQELKIEGNQNSLLKCPKCRYPAKANTRLKYCCTRNLCNHEFCKNCLGPFLDNHKCSIPELNNSFSNIVVGSKNSRKNLRRLKA